MTTTPLLVTLPAVANRGPLCEPVTVGMPFPAGLVRDERDIHLSDEMGQAIALQARATDRWADGSIRWALLDFLLTGEQARERQFTVQHGRGHWPAPGFGAARARDHAAQDHD